MRVKKVSVSHNGFVPIKSHEREIIVPYRIQKPILLFLSGSSKILQQNSLLVNAAFI